LWDIGGQVGQIAPYRHRFYEGASAAFIVIDRTRPNNLESVKIWIKDIKESVPDNIPVVIVGNKSDLKEELVISEEEIKILAKELGFHYILTSCKTGENVNEAFLYIAYRFIEKA
jgi:small GTP-binding protein